MRQKGFKLHFFAVVSNGISPNKIKLAVALASTLLLVQYMLKIFTPDFYLGGELGEFRMKDRIKIRKEMRVADGASGFRSAQL
jgi:hypothetical protein